MGIVHRVLARYIEAALEVGYGTRGVGFTWQADFPQETECSECGEPARLAIVVREKGEGQFVTDLHPNEPKGEGFWLHDAGSFATYLCTDIDCAKATTLWNQA
jgi:hypothetical protein